MTKATEFYTELYDAKTENVRVRPTSAHGLCPECKRWSGHEVACSKVTLEDVANLLKQSRKNEQHARDRAANWLSQLQRLTGKLAILRHENNRLRKANEQLRAEKS